MRKMLSRCLLLVAALVAAVSLAAPLPAAAAFNPLQPACQSGGGASSVCNTGTGDPIAGPNGAIIRVTSILALIAGFVSIIFLVWGGFKYITSNGDSSGVSQAKATIIAALVGVVIAALARPIVNFVIGKL
jgi:hypothetical protein